MNNEEFEILAEKTAAEANELFDALWSLALEYTIEAAGTAMERVLANLIVHASESQADAKEFTVAISARVFNNVVRYSKDLPLETASRH
mgnify:CR=1 FL=1|tara:strand:- start:849 stop:1115 length:267 start_codon:yes stop_codon:yes gene_type:complete